MDIELKLVQLLLLFTFTNATEFSIKQVDNAFVSPGFSAAPGRNERDCAMQCELLGDPLCSAVAFVPETGLCLLSTLRNASFGAAGGSGHVFRRSTGGLEFEPYVLGNRVFYRIQQRVNGNVSFARNWTEYENGFGDGSNFWVGLKTIHELTGRFPRIMRVEAVTWSDVFTFCEYSGFTVGNASTNYVMNFGSYLSSSSNMSKDSLGFHRGMQFSTMDRDNDKGHGSCSTRFGYGGWWFRNCLQSNPNAQYCHSGANNISTMTWSGATSNEYIALKSIRLMIQLT